MPRLWETWRKRLGVYRVFIVEAQMLTLQPQSLRVMYRNPSTICPLSGFQLFGAYYKTLNPKP